MGKFNWKRAIAGGSEYIRGQNEEKRAYERQDKELAQALYAKMLTSGVDPASLDMDAAGLGSYMKKALEDYGRLMPEADRKAAEKEMADWEAKYEKQKQYDLAYSPTMNKPQDIYEGVAEPIKAPMQHFNITPTDWRAMSNAQRNQYRAEYSRLGRKPEGEGGEGKRPRYNIRQDPTTGAVYKFDLDTNQETLVKPETPEHKKNREAKEKKQIEDAVKKNEEEARKVFDKFSADPTEERLTYYNDWLKLYGKTIIKIPKGGIFGGNTYDLAPLEAAQSTGNPQDPLGINQ